MMITPPHNVEAERSILCAILIDNDCIRRLDLLPEDFYVSDHQKIYDIMLGLSQNREAIDTITVSDKGISPSLISEIANTIPSSALVKSHTKIVQECSQRRRILQTAQQVIMKHADVEIPELRSMIVSGIKDTYEKVDIVTPRTFAENTLEHVERVSKSPNHVIGIPTGFADVDRLMGGLQQGELVILASRPGMGKTAFKDNVVKNASRAGHPVGVFELEMSERQSGLRHFSDLSNVPLYDLKHGNISGEYGKRLVHAVSESAELPIYRCFTGGLTIERLESQVEKLVDEHGIQLVVIDYLQLLKPSRYKEREQQVAHISQSAKNIAKEFNVAVVCLSQLNRSCEQRPNKRPLMSDLRESGAIEQDADIVAFLFRSDYYDENINPGVAELIILKNRNGSTGFIELQWQPEYTRFNSLYKGATIE